MAENLIPHELVLYNAQYGVLICRECQYGIQKSGISSHLLRHKVYRNARQELLASISKLRLFEPEDVTIPPANSPPIAGLPVIQGYRCVLDDCSGHLCASLKRMRQHWSEKHESREERDKQTFFEEVKMQTFFRGTKLRYFEVQSATARGTEIGNAAQEIDHGNIDGDHSQYQSIQDVDMTGSSSSSPSASEETSSVSCHVIVDLETLNYFHHFNTKTKFTLPLPEDKDFSTSSWQDDLVDNALKRKWLMCGLLSIAACHVAVLEKEFIRQHSHYERARKFLKEFDTGWRDVQKIELPSEIMANTEDEEAKKIGEHIQWLLRFVRCIIYDNLSTSDSSLELFHTSPLRYLITTVKGRNISLVKFNRLIADKVDNRSFEVNSLSISLATNTINPSTPTFPELIERLQILPGGMADAFGKPEPENLPDVVNTFLAIEMLIQCCNMIGALDDADTIWNSMALWLSKLTDYFYSRIPRCHRGALVVLAHWLVLVKRAEDLGLWFLKGIVENCWREIENGLSAENEETKSLIEGLVV